VTVLVIDKCSLLLKRSIIVYREREICIIVYREREICIIVYREREICILL